jgi:thiol:disulfide interchange protein
MFMVLGTAIHLIKAIFKGYQPMEQYTFELYGAVGAFVGIILYMVRV